MTGDEFQAIQAKLGLTNDALAAELGLTPAVIEAWREGRAGVPRRHAETLRWKGAVAERKHALDASGLPYCAWLAELENKELPAGEVEMAREMERVERHMATCPTCRAREAFVNERFGPMPPPPAAGGVLGTVVGQVDRFPKWAQPAAFGALFIGGMTIVRMVVLLPRLFRHPQQLPSVLLAIVAAMGAGASGGLVYSAARGPTRRLGRAGDYLLGVICMYTYLGIAALVAPIAFGRALVRDRLEFNVFLVVGLGFGLLIGHSWFRESETADAAES